MANLTRDDREIIGGITQISGATSNPTTATDDVIDLISINFVLAGSGSGLIDGLGGLDELRLNSVDLRDVVIQGIETTTLSGVNLNTIEADQLGNLGTLGFTEGYTPGNTFIDGRLRLDYTGVVGLTTLGTTGIGPIGDDLRIEFSQLGQVAGQQVVGDFSGIVRGTVNSLFSYVGAQADETITGTAGDDSIEASSGTNDVDGGAGNDTLRASSGVSTLLGGAGDDSVVGSGLSGLLAGGAGDDTITQSTGRFDSGAYVAVEISGGADNDDISVGSVQGAGSTVRGDAGDDTIRLSSVTMVNGTVDGGTGTDLLEVQSSNLTGTDFSGIEATTILNNGFVTLDASEFVDLGTVTFTDTFPTLGQTIDDANIQLSFAGGAA
ncbi:MAG: hypothetical protein WBA67_13810, partial [Jannaschia sp.]